MYYINKIIGFVASPVGLAIIGGAGALVCARLGRWHLAKWLGWSAALWLWLWSTPIVTWLVGAPLEREFLVDGRVPTVESFPEADAIVLLGGGMGADTNRSPYAEMALGADRVWQAARLYKAGKAKKIVATGFSPQDTTLPLLKDLGVPEDRVSFVEAKNTEEEAKGVEKSVSGGKILLVTSAWHMKRARFMFEKYAPRTEVICAPADFEQLMMSGYLFSPQAPIPDAYALHLNSCAAKEWVGYFGYWALRR